MTTPSEPGDVGVLVPAAGSGRRMGGRKKAFMELLGRPLLARTLEPFLSHPRVGVVVVALPAAEADAPPEWLTGSGPRLVVVAGGETRTESVYRALNALPDHIGVVAVHDAARPLVTREVIDRCLDGVGEDTGVVAGWPSVDTLKEVDEEGRVVATPPRDRFRRAQTPQVFPRAPLEAAYRASMEAGDPATDDSALFARAGGRVQMVAGDPWNLKVTHPGDLEVAAFLLRRRGEGGAV
jgi:2-C-methyl-D-erythritol 4-phosphate cytidylyltransferase